MKKFIFSIINKVIILLLIFLGFACDSDDDINGTVEYGSPYADFKATGTILGKLTMMRLSNIQVAMDGDTIYSNLDGTYEITVRNSPDLEEYTISFVDTGNIYFPLDTVIDYSDLDFKNMDQWYKGIKTMELDIKLNSREQPD